MDSINQLKNGNPLLDSLQSGSGLKKTGLASTLKDGAQPSEGLGNILQSFGGVLKDQMSHINNLQTEANQAQQTYATGGEIELHNVIIAAEKADLSLQLAMQIRNKAVAAYQEISHMTV